MAEGADASDFDASRAELFESLGHPVRIRILHALQDGPLGFSDLKRKVGIESGGHLQFHLGKLDGLIRSGEDGNYYLTDDGREALRIVGAQGVSLVEETRPETGNRVQPKGRVTVSRSILALLIAALILAASAAVYQQYRLGTLQGQVGTSPTYGTTTIGVDAYWYMRMPAVSIAPDTTIVFHGVKFNFMPANVGPPVTVVNLAANSTFVYVANLAANSTSVYCMGATVTNRTVSVVQTMGTNMTVINLTFGNFTACPITEGKSTPIAVSALNPNTVAVTFPDGTVETLTSGWPLANPPAGFYSTWGGLVESGTQLAGVGSPWRSTHTSPTAAVLLNPVNGTVTIYVREY